MSPIGGPGWPRPDIPEPIVPGMGKAIDLEAIARRAKRQHRFIIVYNQMAVPKESEEEMAATLVKLHEFRANPQTVEPPEINFEIGDIVGRDGPGCAKCGLHAFGDGGYGELCAVDDDDWHPEVLTPGPDGRAFHG